LITVRSVARWTGLRGVPVGLALGSLLFSVGMTGPSGAQTAQVARAATAELRAVGCAVAAACLAAGNGTVIGTSGKSGTWQALTPPGGTQQMLSGVACPTAQICDVVGSGSGDNGAIWRTTDAGATWKDQLTAITGGFFLAVSCPSVSVCEATGNEGTIYGTVNGGKSWRHQPVPESANLIYGISCPSGTTCEAVGYGGTGLALRTTDGGKTWTQQRLPSSLQELQAVSCPSVTVCVAVGINVTHAGSTEVGTVATTTDGGATWTRQSDPAGFTDLTAVTCPTTRACEAGGLGRTHAVDRTTDSGVTWTGQGVPSSVFVQGIACPSAAACRAVGENTEDNGVAYGTTNGGHTWAAQPIDG
jgi:photosystem II stability/assembly factor-like uncharacterized protein